MLLARILSDLIFVPVKLDFLEMGKRVQVRTESDRYQYHISNK